MKRDPEIEKIRGLLNRLDDFEQFIYRGELNEEQTRRILRYVSARKKYLFDYVNATF